MSNPTAETRGERGSTWHVIQRGLAIVRRLMRGPATRADLIEAVRLEVGPDAYSEESGPAERALKNDRTVLRKMLGIEIDFDQRLGAYTLAGLGGMPWLDLGDDDLAAIGAVYEAFAGAGAEAERVRGLLDRLAGLLPPARLPAIQRRRSVLSIELRELDENPIPARVTHTVQQAIAERRRLGFHYREGVQEGSGPRYHEVEPYATVFRQGHWYLECYDLFSRGAKHGRVDQLQHRKMRLQGILDDNMLCVLPEHLPPGRRPQKRYTLAYRLAPPAVRHGISRHFADMQVERLPDGSAVVNATTTDPWDAVRTLLAYGENCVVLGGPEVLSLMRRRVVEMARNYELPALAAT